MYQYLEYQDEQEPVSHGTPPDRPAGGGFGGPPGGMKGGF